MTIAERGLPQRANTYDTVRAQMLEALRRGNKDGAFSTTSRYRVIELRRQVDPRPGMISR